MTHFEIYKLLADIGLFGSLIFFAYRFARSQTPVNHYEMEQLQNGLRNAIREADQAGRGLNDQLFQRKQNLEKLLFDLETVESRVTRSLSAAEERKSELQTIIDRARQIQTDAEVEIRSYKPLETPSFKEVGEVSKIHSEPDNSGRTNIFGEPIVENYTAAAIQAPKARNNTLADLEKQFVSTPLTNQIEKEVATEKKPVPKAPPQPVEQVPVEEIYAQAEDMLRAGKAIDEICKTTQLTADEVRLLSQMLDQDMRESEVSAQATAAQDERLGVLAGFKRQVQIL